MARRSARFSLQAAAGESLLPPGGGGGSTNEPPVPIDRRNKIEFAPHRVSILDTNEIVETDADLYEILIRMPPPATPGPSLAIARSDEQGAVIVRADHFNYTAETADFALLICDKVHEPTFKSIDLLTHSSDALDGWLLQAIVPNRKVSDPMWFYIEGITNRTAFFKAIPYAGPIVAISGVEPMTTVSNTVPIQVTVSDLSGTFDHRYELTVNGLPLRNTLAANNTISMDTRYGPLGLNTVGLTVGNISAMALDPGLAHIPVNTVFNTEITVDLDFQNPTCVAAASDPVSPDIGVNQILFTIDRPQNVRAVIFNPDTGQVMKSNQWYVPNPDPWTPVAVTWNFTDANGGAYTGDTYGVSFAALGEETQLVRTNTIERASVRPAGGVLVNYQHMSPTRSGIHTLFNADMDQHSLTIENMYETIYDSAWGSMTQYTPGQIGPNRQNPSPGFPHTMPVALNTATQYAWTNFLRDGLTNRYYSDFNWVGHGSADRFGGIEKGVVVTALSQDVQEYVLRGSGTSSGNKAYRMRKVAFWSCYGGNVPLDQSYVLLPAAMGIRSTAKQLNTFTWKNAGLFFLGGVDLWGWGSPAASTAKPAALFDSLWVAGPNFWPGGCEPTWAFMWAVLRVNSIYPTQFGGAKPNPIGFPLLPYAGIYDANLMRGDYSAIRF